MKKIILGIFIGSLLTISAQAFAGGELPVVWAKYWIDTRDGEKVEIAALVHNDSAYIEVRQLAFLLEQQVHYDAASRTITLRPQGTEQSGHEKQRKIMEQLIEAKEELLRQKEELRRQNEQFDPEQAE